ncbi:long-chain fatty acid--CoA ligase [Nocardioides sp. NPDC101246]|uniref:long-chain fatty acid--CoA ligase n=1 Tax=Nocardioides sp. NPDC101246 TaxID=3364336 RepID=UPI00382470C6
MALHGLMQSTQLTVSTLLGPMERSFSAKGVTTAQATGPKRTTYGEVAERTRRLVTALGALGLQPGDRVATFGWNSQRHLELYLAVPSAEMVLHTVNHRLFPAQIDYILDHAADVMVVVDASLLDVVWPMVSRSRHIRHVVVMPDDPAVRIPDDERVLDYEQLVSSHQPADGALFVGDERTAAGLCYTSGTTGNPKGVLYDHRSIVLHALMLLGADNLAISEADVVMPVVPMFHANAWGLPYACVMTGADLAMPGNQTDPVLLAEQLERERVTLAAGVATIWRSVLPHLDGRDLSGLRRLMNGGGPLPPSLSAAYERACGLPLTSSWGMTEMSPVGAVSRISTKDRTASEEERRDVLTSPGVKPPLVQMRLRDALGGDVPWDGRSPGSLEVAGPTVAAGYYRNDDHDAITDDGWLRTGDIATLDPHGYLRIVDRAKDLVKSGGEWISSSALENEIMSHPAVLEAAVIGIPDERWEERPLACIVTTEGESLTSEDVRAFLLGRVAKWWIPTDYAFLDELPTTATGKISKLSLREAMAARPKEMTPKT